MRDAKILLIEGKGAGERSFAFPLDKAGYTVTTTHKGADALQWVENNQPDLLLFDASSMRSTGARICSRLRRVLPDTPMIYLSNEALNEASGIEADVYLAQPFTPRKLLNRVRALLPADDAKEEVVRLGTITLYRSKRSVDVGGQGERPLTPKLAQLLEEFLRYPNQIVSRRQLMQNVWKTDYIGDTRTLDVHIRWVRECIEENPTKPKLLKTVRGKGYMLRMLPPNEQKAPPLG